MRGSLYGKIRPHAEISATATSFKVMKDSIESRVTKTEFEGLAVGGRNLILSDNVSALGTIDKNYYAEEGRVRISVVEGVDGMRFNIPSVKPNTKYVLSYKYKKVAGTLTTFGGHSDTGYVNNYVVVDGVRRTGVYQDQSSAFVANDTNEHKVEVYFTTGPVVYGYELIYIQPNRSNTTPATVDVWDVKFEEGTKATGWTPAPEDLIKSLRTTGTSANFVLANRPDISSAEFHTGYGLRFQVTENVAIGRVKVDASVAGEATFYLCDTSRNEVVDQRKVTLAAGKNFVNLGFLLKKDVGLYHLVNDGAMSFRRITSNGSHPSGTFQVLGGISRAGTDPNNGYYYYEEIEVAGAGVDGKIVSSELDGRFTTTLSAIDQTASGVLISAKSYVQSRTENLITNGSGLLGTNENFTSFTLDKTQVYSGGGSFFTAAQNSTLFSDEFIPVDPSQAYRLQMMAKSLTGLGHNYFGMVCFDIDRNTIGYNHVYSSGDEVPVTTLARELKAGDTEIHLTSSTGFIDTTFTNEDHKHSILFWGYTNKQGYTYPEKTYSRLVFRAGWNNAAINRTTHVITLNRPFSCRDVNNNEVTFPVGHRVSPTMDGSGYNYAFGSNVKVSKDDWQRFQGDVTGIGRGSNNFRPGTAFIKLLFLVNRSSSGGTAGDNLWMSCLEALNVSQEKNANEFTSSQIKVQKDRIDLVVTSEGAIKGDALVSAISVQPDNIKIASKNINIDGAVKFSSFDSVTRDSLVDSKEDTNIVPNGKFEDWDGAVPTGWTRWTGQGSLSKTKGFSHGNAARFVVTAAQQDGFMGVSNGKPNAGYFMLELSFMLEAGTGAGAGILFRQHNAINGGGSYNQKFLNIRELVPTPVIGQWYNVKTMVKIPQYTGTISYVAFLMANYTAQAGGLSAKTISFDKVVCRPATETELLTMNRWIVKKYDVGNQVSASFKPTFDFLSRHAPSDQKVIEDTSSFSSMFSGDYYVVQYSTALFVPQDRTITFALKADDTATIYANGVEAGFNTGLTAKSVSVSLKAGWNNLDVLLYEHAGAETMELGVLTSDYVSLMDYSKNPSARSSAATDAVSKIFGSVTGIENDVTKIDGGKIITNSILTDKLIAGGRNPNLAAFGYDCFDQLDLGSVPVSEIGTGTSTIINNAGLSMTGGKVLQAVSSTAVLSTPATNYNIDVIAGKTYIVSGYGQRTIDSGSYNNGIGVRFSNGTVSSSTTAMVGLNGWVRIHHRFTVPTGITKLQIWLLSSATWYWDCIQLEQAEGGQLEPSPWRASGMTVIDGGNIKANTVTASQINVANLAAIKADLGTVNAGTLNVGGGVVVNSAGITATRGSQVVKMNSTDGFVITNGSTKMFEVDTGGNITAQSLRLVSGTMEGSTENMIRNTRFTDYTNHWTHSTSWTFDFLKMFEDAHTMKFESSGLSSNTWSPIYSEFVNATPGETYTASGYAMSDDVTTIDQGFWIEIEFFNSSNTKLVGGGSQFSGLANNVWTRGKVTSTAPANAVKVRVRFHAQRNGRGWLAKPMLQHGSVVSEHRPHVTDVVVESGQERGISFRYIRDWLAGSTINTGRHWVSIEAYVRSGPKVIDIAKTKTVTSGGPGGAGSNLDRVTNGLRDTNLWGSTTTPTSNEPTYVMVDLGAVRSDVEYLQVFHYFADGRRYYKTKTEVSVDGIAWFPLFDSRISGEYAETSAGKKILVNTHMLQARTDESVTAVVTTENNTTVIDGGSIKTGSIHADKIIAGTITAGMVNAGTLSAITADLGTVTAGTINIGGGVVINSTGVTATNGTTGVVVKMNSTTGFEILKSGQTVFTVDTAGKLTARGITIIGGSITWGTGTDKVQPPTASDVGAAVTSDITNAVNAIRIGGKNLLRNSGVPISTSSYNINTYTLTEPIQNNSQVTVSMKATLGAGKQYFGLYNSGGTVSVYSLSSSHLGSDGIYRGTFNWTVGSSSNVNLTVYHMQSSTVATSTIEWIKLEYGNKATDWSPAPEDVAKEIGDLQATTSDMMSDMKVTPLEKNELKRLWDSIKVEDTNLRALATSVGTVNASAVSNFTAAFTALNTTAPRIEADILNSMNTTYTFGSETLRNTFKSQLNTYFTRREELQKAIGEAQNTKTVSARDKIDSWDHGLDDTKIDGGKIYTNSITANQIAAGAITTSKLAVTSPNLLNDVDSFEQMAPGRVPMGSAGNTATVVVSEDYAYHGIRSLKLTSGATADSYKYLNPSADNANGWVELKVGKRYIISAYVRTTSTAATAVNLVFVPREGKTTTSLPNSVAAAGTITAADGWVRIQGISGVTSGTAPYAAFYIRNRGTNIVTYWDAIQIEEVIGDNVEAGSFGSGGITRIDGSNIVTGTLSANQITTGTLNAQQVTITNLNASNIRSGTLDASLVNVTNLKAESIKSGKISGWEIEGSTFRTVTSAIQSTQFDWEYDLMINNASILAKERLFDRYTGVWTEEQRNARFDWTGITIWDRTRPNNIYIDSTSARLRSTKIEGGNDSLMLTYTAGQGAYISYQQDSVEKAKVGYTAGASTTFSVVNAGGAVEVLGGGGVKLFHVDSAKLSTTTTGVSVTGSMAATGTVSGATITSSGTMTATGTITGGNITTSGTLTGGTTNLNGVTTVTRNGESLILKGTDHSYAGFYVGTTRNGWIGNGSGANNIITLAAERGNLQFQTNTGGDIVMNPPNANAVSITGSSNFTLGGNIRMTGSTSTLETYAVRPADAANNLLIRADQEVRFVTIGSAASWTNIRFGTGYGAIAANSKREYKENILPYGEDALAKIEQTPIREYNYKWEEKGRRRIGIMVDETEAKEIIALEEDGVDTYGMTAMSWKAIQQLAKRNTYLELSNEALHERMESLEEKNRELEERLARIEALLQGGN